MRERWLVGLPAAIIAILGLGGLTRPYRRRRSRARIAETTASRNSIAA